MSQSKPNNSASKIFIDDEVYYFSHIPKTGGTSFAAILDRYFDVDEIFEPQLWWEVGDVSAVREKHYRCFRGHFGMGAQVLSKQPFKTLTLLRSPIRMAYSTYQYIKREPNTAKHHYVTSKQLTFEDFVQDPETQNLCKNRLIKSLSFGSSMLSMNQDLVLTPENFKSSRKHLNREVKDLSIDQVYEMVKTYLDCCYWVGVLEDFERSLMLLCHQMAWPYLGTTQKLNTHPRAPIITETAAQIVDELNHFDNKLYAYAKSAFENRFKNTFRQQLTDNNGFNDVIEAIDQNYQKLRLSAAHRQLPDRISYQFSMPLIGQNWHNREWNEAESKFFRWTGPGSVTTIDFWLKPNDYQLELLYLNIADKSLLEQLSVAINGVKVKWRSEVEANAGKLVILCKQSDCHLNGLLRLEIKTKQLKSHHEIFRSNDNRLVGFAVKSINIIKQDNTNS